MPNTHSELFNAPSMVMTVANEQRLNRYILKDWVHSQELPAAAAADGNSLYDKLSDLLRETNDAQFGIVTSLQTMPNGETALVRDATASIRLDDRMPHDSPVIEANNALLRCLSRLRAIDYAIAKKYPGDEGLDIRRALKKGLGKLIARILDVPAVDIKDKLNVIKQLEKNFDTFLVEKLHEANLTKGCETAKDAEKLLSQYRNLSSLLVPARIMITLTYDTVARVLQRETQYPVTEKTPEQIAALESLRTINPHPLTEDKTSHSVSSVAMQEADSLFVDLMKGQDRALPAQTRKTHLVGAKNAFIVKNELIFVGEGEDLDAVSHRDPGEGDTLWLARSGVPVYVGKGESEQGIAQNTAANLEQIRMAARTRMGRANGQLNLHVTSLNTVSPINHQDKMVSHLYKATRKAGSGDDISYMPTNLDGTFRFLDIAPTLFASNESRPYGSSPLQKATRLDSVSAVMLKATTIPNTLSLVQCASGQDRTGTAVEKTTQKWMLARYAVRQKLVAAIQTIRAEGGNAAEIASHHLPGSPGMKKAAIADNNFGTRTTFDSLATRQFYRKSACTNKKSPIGDVHFLKKPSVIAKEEYQRNLDKFKAALSLSESSTGARLDLVNQGKDLIVRIDAITKNNPESVNATTLADLNAVLFHGTQALTLTQPNDVLNNSKILAGIAKHASRKANMKQLSDIVMMCASLALVITGILLFVPTGGISLVASAVGAVGLIASSVAESRISLDPDISSFRTAMEKVHAKNAFFPAVSLSSTVTSPSCISDEGVRLLQDDEDCSRLGLSELVASPR